MGASSFSLPAEAEDVPGKYLPWDSLNDWLLRDSGREAEWAEGWERCLLGRLLFAGQAKYHAHEGDHSYNGLSGSTGRVHFIYQ